MTAFDTRMRGYDMEQVDKFIAAQKANLNDLAAQHETLQQHADEHQNGEGRAGEHSLGQLDPSVVASAAAGFTPPKRRSRAAYSRRFLR